MELSFRLLLLSFLISTSLVVHGAPEWPLLNFFHAIPQGLNYTIFIYTSSENHYGTEYFTLFPNTAFFPGGGGEQSTPDENTTITLKPYQQPNGPILATLYIPYPPLTADTVFSSLWVILILDKETNKPKFIFTDSFDPVSNAFFPNFFLYDYNFLSLVDDVDRLYLKFVSSAGESYLTTVEYLEKFKLSSTVGFDYDEEPQGVVHTLLVYDHFSRVLLVNATVLPFNWEEDFVTLFLVGSVKEKTLQLYYCSWNGTPVKKILIK